MIRSLSPEGRVAVGVAALLFVVAAILLAGAIPPVEGLGAKVRLPIFHGGSTWVNLAAFAVMGVFSLGYLLMHREDLYRWATGFRWVAAGMWVLNTVLGVIAAIQTWDFSGSQQIPLTVVRQDPRLMAQFQLLLLLAIVLIIETMFESRNLRAFLDFVYAATMGIWLGVVLNSAAARALHPDSPVLNSGSDIQIPFYAIVGCLFVAASLFAWLVRDRIVRTD